MRLTVVLIVVVAVGTVPKGLVKRLRKGNQKNKNVLFKTDVCVNQKENNVNIMEKQER